MTAWRLAHRPLPGAQRLFVHARLELHAPRGKTTTRAWMSSGLHGAAAGCSSGWRSPRWTAACQAAPSFPTLSARLAQQQLLWQGTGSDWRVGFSATRTRYSDPTPYLHTGAIDSRSTRVRLEAAWGALAVQAGPWGVKPYVDYIDSSDYGSKQRLGLELNHHWQLGAAPGVEY